jgi:hypothetical protein
MHKYRVFLALGISGLISAFLIQQQSGIEIVETQATVLFPDEIEFSIEIESDVIIEVVELEYGLDVSSCVTDVNRVIPEDFQPAYDVNTYWVWNMRRTGSLPPGARLWWRWHVIDQDGIELRTEKQWLTWLDHVHPWDVVQSGNVYLHWYSGDESFARQLLDAAVDAQDLLEEDIGTHLYRDVHLYIYADTADMREAVLFEPGWTGGLAYPGFAIVLIGITPYNLDWGLDTISHEFAHVVVGNAVDHCYSRLPTWLDEGLAVYAEGGLGDNSEYLLSEAIEEDQLLSVRSLSDGFAEHEGMAILSYAQSYSLVDYLIDTYGQESMLALLQAFQDGYRYDTALEKVYGFDADGLDRAWRGAVGANTDTVDTASFQATPTVFPTIQPYVIESSAETDLETPVSEVAIAEVDSDKHEGEDKMSEVASEESAQDGSFPSRVIGFMVMSVAALIAITFWVRWRKSRLMGGDISD